MLHWPQSRSITRSRPAMQVEIDHLRAIMGRTA
jgi:hypothetical protein